MPRAPKDIVHQFFKTEIGSEGKLQSVCLVLKNDHGGYLRLQNDGVTVNPEPEDSYEYDDSEINDDEEDATPCRTIIQVR